MVKLSVENIGQDAMDYNLAKAGYTAFYVDGTNGLDTYPGDSWEQPFKTIQHAVDTAESWAQIFIKSGTYVENVVIPSTKDAVQLIGENKTSVIIKPVSGMAIRIESDSCEIHFLTAIGNGAGDGGIECVAERLIVDDVVVGNQATTGGVGLYAYSAFAYLHRIQLDQTYPPKYGIYITGNYNNVTECIIENAGSNNITIYSNYNEIYNNIIANATVFGVYCGEVDNTIFHNNFIGNGTQARDDGTDNEWYENYYDDHTNIDNGFGIATEPYAFTSGTDPRPVVCRNGWKGLSWADADQVGLIKTETDKLAGGEYTETVSAGTAAETLLKEIITTSRMEIKSIWLDLVNLVTDGATIKLYHKVDGTNYRVFEIDSWSLTDDDGILIHGFTINNDFKITITGGESAGVDIPYNIIYQTMEG